jgi:formylglycine-generating enzyme required for sulfatase activity
VAEIEPQGLFTISPEEDGLIAKISYTQNFGYLDCKAAMVDGEIITAVLQPDEGEAIRHSMTAEEGQLQWQSSGIPAGTYELSYLVPPYFKEVPPQRITIAKDETLEIHPSFICKRILEIATNIDEASYTLHSHETGHTWEGVGRSTTFSGLFPGSYTVIFSQAGNEEFLLPEKRQIVIAKDDDTLVEVEYSKSASLVISANVDTYDVTVYRLDDNEEPTADKWTGSVEKRSRTLKLAEGNYRIAFLPLNPSLGGRYGDNHPEALDVRVTAARPQRVHGVYEASKGSLVVTSNLSKAAYTVRDISDEEGLIIGRFHGEYTVIPMTYVGRYEILFEEVTGYRTPERVITEVAASDRQVVGGTYFPLQAAVEVSDGSAIIGDVFGEGAEDEKPARTVQIDSFRIATYEVTNAQYAAWLTGALERRIVIYDNSPTLRGQVRDRQGKLLFETVDADPNSQIEARPHGESYTFHPIPGREQHPVIEVSWHGANAYCEDNGCRLPTEAEWEKAASMAIAHLDKPLKKFRYSCGSDTIDRTVVNFQDSYDSSRAFVVRTSEIGHFDGENLLALGGASGLGSDAYSTRPAPSPRGCYDMSGNVREWVADWYDSSSHKKMATHNPKGPGHGTKKVTKGGCYDSFAYEVRCSARLALSPETTDAFTGFRVVLAE